MIKYFHELTEKEFNELCKTPLTWEECVKEYPRPEWCAFPDAVDALGCWSLTGFRVTGRKDCKSCEFYIKKEKHGNASSG